MWSSVNWVGVVFTVAVTARRATSYPTDDSSLIICTGVL
ncbi:hypothetical protein Vi05172_g9530 [Venturia inaequalis]|nr:hypothetical protein Vi05172_g9530 [Venturia inaequalis]